MPAVNHPAYKEELERCQYTLEYVRKTFDSMMKKKERIDQDIDYAKKHFDGESSQSYIDLMINTTLQGNIGLKIRNLAAAKKKPYFARVDFREKDREDLEKMYIGKMALIRDEDQEMIIIDWRAPVANLYYEGRLGEASYTSPDGIIDGDLLVKRQFTINDGILQEIMDIDITASDELLQASLGANADNRLKDIVSTIQEEQNRIIRADMWTPLIVQGAAGSGKTTIALHRIAYLIYTYEKSFQPENFMIIAPNTLFLNYISEILPELGVERVKQTTFENFAMELIGKKLKLRDPNEKLVMFVSSKVQDNGRKELLRRTSEFKSSMLYKKVLDAYVSSIEENFIPREDFKFGNFVIFRYEDINRLFLQDYKNWPVLKRMDEIKKYLTNRLKVQKNRLVNQLEEECDKQIRLIKAMDASADEMQFLMTDVINEKEEKIGKLEKHSNKLVGEYMRNIRKVNAYQYYRDFITDPQFFKKAVSDTLSKEKEMGEEINADLLDSEFITFFREYSEQIMRSGYVEIEDLAPIIYLKYLIYGMDEKIPVKHIVIDEAQDFSVFQLYVVKKIIKESSFTILGDLCQGIHSYRGTRDWNDVRDGVFSDGKSEFLTLEQSYRTTVEIMDAANKVIDGIRNENLITARPVIRHGEKVRIFKSIGIKEMAGEIGEKIAGFKKEGYKSIAVICKTLDDCREMEKLLGKDAPAVITGLEKEYKGGVVIVPSYLAKGLEFDAVIIAGADRERYRKTELDAKLLYVAMTRPLHKLHIYHMGELSPLLEEK